MASQSQSQSALLLTEFGKPLVKSTLPVENPAEGHVQVKISATSLVPADYKIRDHGFPGVDLPLPLVLGFEIAGRVVASPSSTSSSSSPLPIGTRVAFQPSPGPLAGGLKEYSSVDPALVIRVPGHLSDEQAATLGCNPFTAAMALFHPESGFGLPLPGSAASAGFDYAGARLVVIGGTAVAKFAVQQARLAGVGTVVAVASPASLADLAGYGATHGVDRHLHAGEIIARVRDAVHGGSGGGPLFVLDAYNLPDTSFVPSLFSACGGGGGGIVVMSSPAAARDDAALAAAGAEARSFRAWYPEQRALADAWLPLFNGWLAEGRIAVPPFQVIPLEAGAVNEALQEIKKGGVGVKYVVRIGAE